MGTVRSGLLACLLMCGGSFAQAPNPNAPVDPGAVPPTNAPVTPPVDAVVPIDPVTGLPIQPQPIDPALQPVDPTLVVTNAAPAPKKAPVKKAAPKTPSVRGTVAKLDKVHMTLTV